MNPIGSCEALLISSSVPSQSPWRRIVGSRLDDGLAYVRANCQPDDWFRDFDKLPPEPDDPQELHGWGHSMAWMADLRRHLRAGKRLDPMGKESS